MCQRVCLPLRSSAGAWGEGQKLTLSKWRLGIVLPDGGRRGEGDSVSFLRLSPLLSHLLLFFGEGSGFQGLGVGALLFLFPRAPCSSVTQQIHTEQCIACKQSWGVSGFLVAGVFWCGDDWTPTHTSTRASVAAACLRAGGRECVMERERERVRCEWGAQLRAARFVSPRLWRQNWGLDGGERDTSCQFSLSLSVSSYSNSDWVHFSSWHAARYIL